MKIAVRKVDMIVELKPTNQQLSNWATRFVPDKDLFFIEEKDLVAFGEDLNNVLVISRKEFLAHPSYRRVDFANSYIYWNISNKAEYVIVASPSWITRLSKQKKKHIFNIQLKMERGLIFPVSFFPCIPKELMDYVLEEKFVVLQFDMWSKLPNDIKINAIEKYALLWDDWTCYEVPKDVPGYIKKFANRFSNIPGSNCLSATLFALTKQEWILDEWVHQETFKQSLLNAHYIMVNDQLKTDDIVTWVNEDQIIQHAAYHIGNHLFFNKNGQTVFNPMKIIHWNQLCEQWGKNNIIIYRKKA